MKTTASDVLRKTAAHLRNEALNSRLRAVGALREARRLCRIARAIRLCRRKWLLVKAHPRIKFVDNGVYLIRRTFYKSKRRGDPHVATHGRHDRG